MDVFVWLFHYTYKNRYFPWVIFTEKKRQTSVRNYLNTLRSFGHEIRWTTDKWIMLGKKASQLHNNTSRIIKSQEYFLPRKKKQHQKTYKWHIAKEIDSHAAAKCEVHPMMKSSWTRGCHVGSKWKHVLAHSPFVDDGCSIENKFNFRENYGVDDFNGKHLDTTTNTNTGTKNPMSGTKEIETIESQRVSVILKKVSGNSAGRWGTCLQKGVCVKILDCFDASFLAKEREDLWKKRCWFFGSESGNGSNINTISCENSRSQVQRFRKTLSNSFGNETRATKDIGQSIHCSVERNCELVSGGHVDGRTAKPNTTKNPHFNKLYREIKKRRYFFFVPVVSQPKCWNSSSCSHEICSHAHDLGNHTCTRKIEILKNPRIWRKRRTNHDAFNKLDFVVWDMEHNFISIKIKCQDQTDWRIDVKGETQNTTKQRFLSSRISKWSCDSPQDVHMHGDHAFFGCCWLSQLLGPALWQIPCCEAPPLFPDPGSCKFQTEFQLDQHRECLTGWHRHGCCLSLFWFHWKGRKRRKGEKEKNKYLTVKVFSWLWGVDNGKFQTCRFWNDHPFHQAYSQYFQTPSLSVFRLSHHPRGCSTRQNSQKRNHHLD